jgi:hypothetical protein
MQRCSRYVLLGVLLIAALGAAVGLPPSVPLAQAQVVAPSAAGGPDGSSGQVPTPSSWQDRVTVCGPTSTAGVSVCTTTGTTNARQLTCSYTYATTSGQPDRPISGPACVQAS